MATVRSAAAQAQLSPGAYAAHVLVSAARQELTAIPLDDHERIAELIQARIAVSRIGVALLQARATPQIHSAELTTALTAISHAIRRIEQAADVIAAAYRPPPAPQ